MNLNPRDTDNRPGTNPDHGMNARNFVAIVIVAVLVFIVGIGIFLVAGGRRSNSPQQHQAPSSDASPANPSDSGHTNPQ